MEQLEDVKVVATVIADDRRNGTLERYFGRTACFTVEPSIYTFMRRLDPNYVGGMWEFVELSNGGFFMYPRSTEALIQLSCNMNGASASVSPEVAGLVACIFTMSHMSFSVNGPMQELLSNNYERLMAYAGDHPEAQAIFHLID